MGTDATVLAGRVPAVLPPLAHVPLTLAGTTVGLQISYPLTSGPTRTAVTVTAVLCFAATSFSHALVGSGVRAVTGLLGAAALGFGVEIIGVHTGVPFGRYSYGNALGPRLAGVPLLVAAAWAMMAWPCAAVARRLARGAAARVLVGAVALASWDLFLDPQQVAAGYWHWAFGHGDSIGTVHLPGVPGVPLSNYGGWLLVSLAISAILQFTLADRPVGNDAIPLALYLWTYASSVLALALFLNLRAPAGWGALGMGLTAVPLAVVVTRARRMDRR